ncbi:hypothetical protein MRX96_055349 [Rhipicephalus microplus]
MIIERTRPSKLSCLPGAKADRSERAASRETSRRLERPQRFYRLLSRTCWKSQQVSSKGTFHLPYARTATTKPWHSDIALYSVQNRTPPLDPRILETGNFQLSLDCNDLKTSHYPTTAPRKGGHQTSQPRMASTTCILAPDYNTPNSERKELKAAFLLLDKNQDGRVNAAEIKHMLDNLGILLNDSMIQKLVVQASGRDDGLISEDEFLAWMTAQTSIKDDVMEDLLAAFRVFDKDANGYITKDELKLAMEMIGEPMSEAQLDSMIRATDIDNDGRINYEEFVTILL